MIAAQFSEVDFRASRPGKPKLRLITMATGSIGYAPVEVFDRSGKALGTVQVPAAR